MAEGRTKEQLVDMMSRELERFPGVTYNFTQPMAMRLDEVISGVKADVAVKIFGDDEHVLNEKADEVMRLLSRYLGPRMFKRRCLPGPASGKCGWTVLSWPAMA